MTPHDYLQLLQSTEGPDVRVRRALEALQADTRELALLAIGEWESANVPSREMGPALAAIDSPTWGSWNGLLLAVQSLYWQTLASGSAEQRERLERSTGLGDIFAFLAGLPPALAGPAAALAEFAGAPAPAKVQDVISIGVGLQVQIAYERVSDAAWFERAAELLAPFLQFMSRDPLAGIRRTVLRRSPWFLSDQDLSPKGRFQKLGAGQPWMFSGRGADFSAVYSAPGDPPRTVADLPAINETFSRLLSGGEMEEDDLRRVLEAQSSQDVRGFLLGDFLVGPPVGAGGLGTVHRGRQLSTGRKVAIKILHDGMPGELRARVLREAGFLAQFHHPHIVQVLAFAEARWTSVPRMKLENEPWMQAIAASTPVKRFIAMEWLEGRSLAEVIDAARREGASAAEKPTAAQITEWFGQAAGALRAVHGAGLVHRDVKPANLRLTSEGTIKLMDFGMALPLDANRTAQPASGPLVGTEAYLSPEQLRAPSAVGPASDIYSLAATFYELYTLKGFYDRDTVDAQTVATKKRSHEMPPPPREHVPDLPWEIETILLGALEIEVEHRYRSMDDLQRDLRHYVRDEPIEYKHPGVKRRLRLAYRRNRAVANGMALAGTAALLGITLYIVSIHAEQARTLAERNHTVKLAAENFEERARQELLDGNPLQSLVLANEAAHLNDQSPALGFIIARGLKGLAPEPGQDDYSPPINSAVFDAKGDHIVTAGINGTTTVWDAHTGLRLKSLPRKPVDGALEMNFAVFSPDGSHIFTVSNDHHLRSWDYATSSIVWGDDKPQHTDKVYGNAMMVSATRIITASEDHSAMVWNAATGDMIGQPITDARGPVASASMAPGGTLAVMAGEDGFAIINTADASVVHRFDSGDALFDARFSPDLRHAVTAGRNALVKLWNLSTPDAAPMVLDGHGDRVRRVRFSSDGSRILSASYDGTARVWNADGQPVTVLSHDHAPVYSAEFSPDGRLIITASADGTAALWQASNGRKLATLRAGFRAVFNATISADNSLAVTAGEDGVCLWNITDTAAPTIAFGASAAYGNLVATFAHGAGAPVAAITAAAFSADQKRLATGDSKGGIYLWDAKSYMTVDKKNADEPSPVTALAFDPASRFLIYTQANGQIHQWNFSKGAVTDFVPAPRDAIPDIALSADGKLLATAARDDHLASVWDVEAQSLWFSFRHPAAVNSVEFSSDGRYLLTSCDDAIARLYHLPPAGSSAAGPRLAPVYLEQEGKYVNDARFSPDGTRVATVGESEARIWSVDGNLVQSLPGTRLVHARWSPDGKSIAVSNTDGAIKIWTEIGKSFKQTASLEGHARVVLSLQFSPDSGFLLSAGDDGMAFLWDPPSGRMLYSFENHARPLTLATFSPDGTKILTAGDDGMARLWQADVSRISPDALSQLLQARDPWQLVNGRLVRK